MAETIERAIRRVRIIAWTLALGWACLVISTIAIGERESSYAELVDGLRAGEINEVQVLGELMPADARGYETVSLRWRQDLFVRTAMLTHATNEHWARNASDGSADPVVVGSVEEHLLALDPDVRLIRGDEHNPSFSSHGWHGSGWLGLSFMLLLVSTLGLIAGPRPWRATRWAWAWLVLLAPLVGVPAYFLFGGPTGLFRPRDPHHMWLTGGWAFLLVLVLGAAIPG